MAQDQRLRYVIAPMPSPYRINLSLPAAKRLAEMPLDQREEIDRQLGQIAELVAVGRPASMWQDPAPLRLMVGPIAVRYVVSDESRVITVTELGPS